MGPLDRIISALAGRAAEPGPEPTAEVSFEGKPVQVSADGKSVVLPDGSRLQVGAIDPQQPNLGLNEQRQAALRAVMAELAGQGVHGGGLDAVTGHAAPAPNPSLPVRQPTTILGGRG